MKLEKIIFIGDKKEIKLAKACIKDIEPGALEADPKANLAAMISHKRVLIYPTSNKEIAIGSDCLPRLNTSYGSIIKAVHKEHDIYLASVNLSEYILDLIQEKALPLDHP